MPKPGEVQRDWHVVDATGQILGRMASKIAVILQGKNGNPDTVRQVFHKLNAAYGQATEVRDE